MLLRYFAQFCMAGTLMGGFIQLCVAFICFNKLAICLAHLQLGFAQLWVDFAGAEVLPICMWLHAIAEV